ncbi:unnamed protein product [Vitrella brassicaformis CCMP3155]|uniref:H/ACA ribonucleoprotein complex non-core subunit NAF1 n=1 Tax=Vitrella brassicaformis (strain CCMP3155) TaxID=1169540 RepID=A0A0G4F5W6_VITBC|nr:unnamed protein product [Vitrella brassicaformis CCMP3155]|mmetsp:Transcript_29759/g.74035  ORF Transcript_29759/g.74035 Transcript_29759/m.74035 type:complete len:397 (-) Transcript_29759:73-1263(-)|eukprot:CEM07884.1 unnamed protein product [Vitrella brassicaformis CCMP3155]
MEEVNSSDVVGDLVIDGETEYDDLLVAARIAQSESHRLQQTAAQGTLQKLAHLLSDVRCVDDDRVEAALCRLDQCPIDADDDSRLNQQDATAVPPPPKQSSLPADMDTCESIHTLRLGRSLTVALPETRRRDNGGDGARSVAAWKRLRDVVHEFDWTENEDDNNDQDQHPARRASSHLPLPSDRCRMQEDYDMDITKKLQHMESTMDDSTPSRHWRGKHRYEPAIRTSELSYHLRLQTVKFPMPVTALPPPPAAQSDVDRLTGDLAVASAYAGMPQSCYRVVIIGEIHAVVDNMVIVRANKESRALDLGSFLCLEDQTILGPVSDAFGPVNAPFYVIFVEALNERSTRKRPAESWPTDDVEVALAKLRKGAGVGCLEAYSSYLPSSGPVDSSTSGQ